MSDSQINNLLWELEAGLTAVPLSSDGHDNDKSAFDGFRARGVRSEYLCRSSPLFLTRGVYEITYNIEAGVGTVSVGIIRSDTGVWSGYRNHSGAAQWTLSIRVFEPIESLHIMIAGANSETGDVQCDSFRVLEIACRQCLSIVRGAKIEPVAIEYPGNWSRYDSPLNWLLPNGTSANLYETAIELVGGADDADEEETAQILYFVQSDILTIDPGMIRVSYEASGGPTAGTLGIIDASTEERLCDDPVKRAGSRQYYTRLKAVTDGIRMSLSGALSRDAAVKFSEIQITEIEFFAAPAEPDAGDGETFPSGELVIFVHIPKTAGTSFVNIMADNCFADAIFRPYFAGRKDLLTGDGITSRSQTAKVLEVRHEFQRRENALQLFSAHLPFGAHQWIDRPCKYLSIMRDPLERVISHYFHAYDMRNENALGEIMEEFSWNLGKAVECGDVYELANDQTRMITGQSKLDLDRQDLELAKEMIREHYELVWTTEDFTKGLKFLESRMHLKNLFPHSENTRKSRTDLRERKGLKLPRISTKSKRLIREFNEVDILLYEWLVCEYLPSI